MLNPEDIINNSDDVRELKRALVANMSAEGTDVSDICKGLGVSDSYVSKRKIIYEKEVSEGLLIKYKGSESYPGAESGKEIIGYTEKYEHISTEELRDHTEGKIRSCLQIGAVVLRSAGSCGQVKK